jgi:hypothetical protein
MNSELFDSLSDLPAHWAEPEHLKKSVDAVLILFKNLNLQENHPLRKWLNSTQALVARGDWNGVSMALLQIRRYSYIAQNADLSSTTVREILRSL